MHEPPDQKAPASDEGQLLRRAAAGDDRALESLIRQYEARVAALCRSILKRPDWTEDAVQESFLRMVQGLSRFDADQEGFVAWLNRIARNAAIDLLRRQNVREAKRFDAAAIDETQAANDSPVDRAIRREDLALLHEVLDALPGPQREVLVLRFLHNLEPQEIAAVLGISPGNARVRLNRALNAVRAALNATNENEANEGAQS
ncbi:MAG: RNA polymerase sigma factor [Planctomycetes bacterium]|nr:RNA polymerase sigma factor [Planctomycetota bacterium]